MRDKGFTLAELLIVIAIIIILIAAVLMNLRGQSIRASDVRRKTDLYKLKNAFEEYYNDHGSFPAAGIISTCGGSDLAPYLGTIPCDPKNTTPTTPYGYFVSGSTGGYRVCTVLMDTTDPVIVSSGCGGPDGCGLGGGYNYCLASGTTASAAGTSDQIAGGTTPTPTSTPGAGTPTTTPNPTPTPTPTPGVQYGGDFACTPAGDCNSYAFPQCKGCPRSYAQSNCNNACGDLANRCTDILVPNCP